MNKRELIKLLGLIPSLFSSSAQANKRPAIQIGVIPHISARSIASQYDPLSKYLSSRLNVMVDISSGANWSDFYKTASAYAYDAVVVPAHIARIMQVELAMKPVAAFHPKIKGILVADKAMRIHSPSQLRGESIVTANPAALVTLEGETWLEKTHGLRKNIDYADAAVRGDDSVGLAVLKGLGVAGVMCKQDFDAFPEAIQKQLSIIAHFAELSNFIVLENPRMDLRMGEELEKHIQTFSKSAADAASFEQRTGFKIVKKPNLHDLKVFDQSAAKIRHLLG